MPSKNKEVGNCQMKESSQQILLHLSNGMICGALDEDCAALRVFHLHTVPTGFATNCSHRKELQTLKATKDFSNRRNSISFPERFTPSIKVNLSSWRNSGDFGDMQPMKCCNKNAYLLFRMYPHMWILCSCLYDTV